MKKWKEMILFVLPLIPVAAAAGYFTALYQLDFLDEATAALVVEQLGSLEIMIPVYIVQTVGYALFCGLLGHILAKKLGLMNPIRFEKQPLLAALGMGAALGVVLALDYWTFGAWIPGIREADAAMVDWNVMVACVLYGGVVEELMLRLFFMSFIAFVIWKLFFRSREQVPEGVVISANWIAAVLFAAGHLPATAMMFGELTGLILLRCFLLNGGAGLGFGWLYRKYGIQYAMIAHALTHVVNKLIWFLFI